MSDEIRKQLSSMTQLVRVLEIRAEKLEAERDALKEIVRDLGPSLIAAVSLLENGGKAAAASDKMFEQMLDDYRGSINRTRAALQESTND